MNTPILAAATQFLVPLQILASAFLLLRGHNEPGGGFIAGLAAAIAILLKHWATPHDNHTTDKQTSYKYFPISRYIRLMTFGLFVAGGSGLFGYILSEPFSTAVWIGSFWLPIVSTVKIGTPFLFDIGVFLVVTGGTVIATVSLTKERQK